MAGSKGRWAIAPPALDGEADELEEFPLSGEPVSGYSRSPAGPECESIAPPTERSTLPADVEVTFTPSDWVRGRTVVESNVPDEVTGLRRAPEPPSPARAESDDGPGDTIPAPPDWRESEPPPRAG